MRPGTVELYVQNNAVGPPFARKDFVNTAGVVVTLAAWLRLLHL